MGKLFLLFVLSIISVFSAPAQLRERLVSDTLATTQIRQRYTDNFDMQSGVKVYTEAQTSNVKTDIFKVQKTAMVSPSNASAALALRMTSGNKSLGAFSTGDTAIDSYILVSCARYNVDPLLIVAQMNQESGFKSKATSYKGARGLMQLMPATAIRFGVTKIYDPEQNINAGVKYLRWLLDKFGGDISLALAGYNAGEGAVMKYGNQIPPFQETQNYVARITTRYNQIKK
jgi:soluble lytic murein transglycosylase-like protein